MPHLDAGRPPVHAPCPEQRDLPEADALAEVKYFVMDQDEYFGTDHG